MVQRIPVVFRLVLFSHVVFLEQGGQPLLLLVCMNLRVAVMLLVAEYERKPLVVLYHANCLLRIDQVRPRDPVVVNLDLATRIVLVVPSQRVGF